MPADFTIKRNDWGEVQPMRVRLKALAVNPETGEVEKDEGGNPIYKPIDLTNAEAVHIFLRLDENPPVKTGVMTIADAAAGLVEYTFEPQEGADPADTSTSGLYNTEFKITWKEGKGLTTVPTVGFYTTDVEKDLS
jgi:hypothetical protein